MINSYKKAADFIRELYGGSDFIPLSVPVFIGNEKKYLNECIDTTFVSSVGKFVDRFEEEVAKYTGSKKAKSLLSDWENSCKRFIKVIPVGYKALLKDDSN